MQIMMIVSDTRSGHNAKWIYLYTGYTENGAYSRFLSYQPYIIPYAESGSKLSLINTCKKFREFRGKTLCIICHIIQRLNLIYS